MNKFSVNFRIRENFSRFQTREARRYPRVDQSVSSRNLTEATSSFTRCAPKGERDKYINGLAKNIKYELDCQSTDLIKSYTTKLELNDQNKNQNKTTLLSIMPGDLVEFKKDGSSHWAVYLGDEKVAHLTSDEDNELVSSDRLSTSKSASFSKIHINSFFEVAGNEWAEFNNILDNEKKPFPREKIMERVAQSLFDEDIRFESSLHFATWCRYGDGTDTEISTWVKKSLEDITDFLHVLRNIVLSIWHA